MKNLSSYFILFFICFFYQFKASSQTNYTGKSEVINLSLQECISRAKANSFQNKKLQSESKISRNNLMIAQNERLPKVSGSAVNYLNLGRSIDKYTNLYTTQTIANQSYGVDLEIPIYQGGQIQKNIAIKETESKLSENAIKQIEQNLTIDVLTAFLGVLNAEEQVTISKQQLEVTKNQLKRLEMLNKEGLSSRIGILEFNVQVSSDELQVINTENELSLSKIKLLQVMNEININDFQIDRKSIETNLIVPYKASINTLLSHSLNNHPSVVNAKGLMKISRLNQDFVKASLKPSVSLGINLGSNFSSAAPKVRFISDGKSKIEESSTNNYVLVNNKKVNLIESNAVPTGYFRNIGYLDQLGQNFNNIIYTNIRIPIYDGGITKKQIENAQINQKINSVQITESEVKLKQVIDLAYKNMQASYKRLVAINKQFVAVEELFNYSKKQLEEGVISSTDYVILKNQFDKVKQNQVQYKYDYILRTKILDFYIDSL